MLAFLVLALALGAAPAASASPKDADTLTVVTLNLEHDANDWPKRLEVIVAGLGALHPDVICLQEVLQNPELPNQAQTLADRLGCRMQFASVDGPERPKRYGNAILTPHAILVGEERNLEPADDYRAVAHVRFAWRGREVDAYSTHLHHTKEGGSIRAAQIRHLMAYVDSTRGTGPLLVAGDFNAELGTPEMKLVRYTDVFHALHPKATRDEAKTFNPKFGVDPGVIDHVFVDKGLKPLASEVIFRAPSADSVWASDHYGLMARLVAKR